MQDFEKSIKKHKASALLQSLYEFLEQNHVDSIFLKCLGVSFYFFHMISYVYYFSMNKITNGSAQYICSFHYYFNLTNILHYVKSYQLTLFIFSLFFTINLVIILNMINHIFIVRILCRKSKNKTMNGVEIIINELSNFFLWHIMFFSLEIFMVGFKITEETDYLKKNISPDNIIDLKSIGIIGMVMSITNGVILNYFNQDYKFLDKLKMRMNLSMKVIFCFFIRVFQLILYNTVSNLELISFVMIYCFLFLNFLLYFADFPFKTKTLNIYFISLLSYSFLNVLILNLFRINILITEQDLLPINAILFLICIKIGQKIYYHFYFYYLLFEEKNKKIPIFVLEEIIALFQSQESNKQNFFFRLGYFSYHKKYCFNSICAMKDKNMETIEKLSEKNESYGNFIFEFIYQNFKDLLETKNKDKHDSEGAEILNAKFLSFLMNYAQNPVLSFYEIQKTLSIKKRFSIYFSLFSLSIRYNIKSRIKIYLRRKESQALDLKKKNTYNEFFKTVEIKKNLENNFKRIIIYKINMLERTLVGFQDFKELFVCNIKLALLIKKFKKDLKHLSQNSPYQKMFKHKFSALLNSLILNKLLEANLDEKHLAELLKSKNDDIYNTKLLYELLGDETVVCEVSFVDHKGKLLEKSKNAKFLNFFGYSSKDGQKVNYASTLMPEFIRNIHEQFVLSYIKQKSKFRPSDFLSFAIDKEDFVFPVNINIALKYQEEKDFIMYGSFTKTNLNAKFCLCNMNGEILDVSRGFFHNIAEEYDFLRVADFKYINIFQLMPNFYESIKPETLIEESKAISQKLYLPKELKAFIESKKKARIEEEMGTSSIFKKSLSPKHSSFYKDHDYFQNIDFRNEKKFAEITFDLSPMQYGQKDCLLKFIVFTITKFKKPEISFENTDFPENINNTTIANANGLDAQNNKFPRLINLFVNEEKKERFGTKLNALQESLTQHVKSKLLLLEKKIFFAKFI